MTPLPWLRLGILLMIAAVLCYLGINQAKPREDKQVEVAKSAVEKSTADQSQRAVQAAEVPRGVDGVQELETDIFAAYGGEGHDMQRDLAILQEGISSFAMLVKNDDLPTGSNAMCVDALRGNNKSGIRFLREDHPMLNADGELIDRWGTPVYFHAVSAQNIGLRSAGPDKLMWTDDDVYYGSAAKPLMAKEVGHE